MASVVTVSAKVEKRLKEKLDRYGVSVTKVVRKALEEEVRRIEREDLEKRLAETSTILGKVEPRVIVEAIRMSREER